MPDSMDDFHQTDLSSQAMIFLTITYNLSLQISI